MFNFMKKAFGGTPEVDYQTDMVKGYLGSLPALTDAVSFRTDNKEVALKMGAISFLSKPICETPLSTPSKDIGFLPLVDGDGALHVYVCTEYATDNPEVGMQEINSDTLTGCLDDYAKLIKKGDFSKHYYFVNNKRTGMLALMQEAFGIDVSWQVLLQEVFMTIYLADRDFRALHLSTVLTTLEKLRTLGDAETPLEATDENREYILGLYAELGTAVLEYAEERTANLNKQLTLSEEAWRPVYDIMAEKTNLTFDITHTKLLEELKLWAS